MSLLGWHVHGAAQIRRGEVLGRKTSSARRDLRPTGILFHQDLAPTEVGLCAPASFGKGKINVFDRFGRQGKGIRVVRVGNTSGSPVLWGIELFGTCHGNSLDRITAGRLLLDGCLREMVRRSEHFWLHKEPGVLRAIQRRGKLRCAFRERPSGRRPK
jgi:hypothetical protein